MSNKPYPMSAWKRLFKTNVLNKLNFEPDLSIVKRISAYYDAVYLAKQLPAGSKGVALPGIFLQGFREDKPAYLSHIFADIDPSGEITVEVTTVVSIRDHVVTREKGSEIKMELYGDKWMAFKDPNMLRSGNGFGESPISGYICADMDDTVDEDVEENADDAGDYDAVSPEQHSTLIDLKRRIERIERLMSV